MENYTELQQMREQLNTLHKKLSNQEIINEALIRASIGKKIKSINRDTIIQVVAATLAIPLFFLLRNLIGLSLNLVIVTSLFFIVAIAYSLYTNSKVLNNNIYTGSLVKTRLNVLKFKQLEWRWLWFSIPFGIFWATWFTYEIKSLIPNPEPLYIGGTIGGIIGLICGINIFRNDQRRANEIISEIEILQKD